MNDDRLIRLPEVILRTSLAKSTIWKWVQDSKFPKPISLSKRCTVWKLSEVMAFIDSVGDAK